MKRAILIISAAVILAGGILMGLLFGKKAPPAKYNPGDQMEHASLAEEGGTVDLPLKQWTVLYFYPKDDTPGCTTQAKEFTALHDDYAQENIVVFGISTDGVESHRKFREKHGLNVRLLSDPEGKLARDFGVKVLVGMCSRDAVVLNPEGKVDVVHRGVSPKGSPHELLEYIRSKKM